MACNDLLGIPKSPLLPLRKEEGLHHLNPFGELLFSPSWKWNQQHQPHCRPKMIQPHPTPSLKKDILLWYNISISSEQASLSSEVMFQNLTNPQKIAVTAINNPSFSEPFIRMLQHRCNNRLFNLNSMRWVDGIDVGQQDLFFEELIQELRIGYLSEPILYIRDASIMSQRMLHWLNKVTNSKVFEYASKGKKGEQNPLWFSKFSYRYLQDWLANELQVAIVEHFFNKTIPQFIVPELQLHLKSIGKSVEAAALAFSIRETHKKSKNQLTSIKLKIKEEEEKFIEARQHRLISIMETADKTKKKNRRRPKKKQSKQQIQAEPKATEPQITCQILEEDMQAQKLKEKDLREQAPRKMQSSQNIIAQPQIEFKQHLKQNKHCNKEENIQRRSSKTPEKKRSVSKNLIRVSPKRPRSPEQARNRDMLQQSEIREKYSEEDKVSATITEDEKSTDARNPFQDFGIEEKQTVKRRRKRGKKESQKFKELKEALYSRLVSRQIDNLVDELGIQTNALYNMKIIAFERVRVFVQSLFPMTNAVLFGSNAIGLSLPNSDVDILLTCLNCYSKDVASEFLAQIAVQINAMGWVVSCSTYLGAKVPIVKLQIDPAIPFLQTKRKQDLFRVYNPALLYHLDHPTGDMKGTIKVDITINIQGVTSVGYESTIFMRDWISKMPIVQKLVVLFKYILSVKGYNSNFTGGIGSYCLFVMIAAYLKDYCKNEDQSVSKEFQNILKWYGREFDNISSIVALRNEGSCFVSQYSLGYDFDEGKKGLLKLIDPITGRLMSSSCNEYNNIKIEFRRILGELDEWSQKIQQQMKINRLQPSDLMKILHSKKSIDKWLNKFQHKYHISLKAIIQGTFN